MFHHCNLQKTSLSHRIFTPTYLFFTLLRYTLELIVIILTWTIEPKTSHMTVDSHDLWTTNIILLLIHIPMHNFRRHVCKSYNTKKSPRLILNDPQLIYYWVYLYTYKIYNKFMISIQYQLRIIVYSSWHNFTILVYSINHL